MDASVLERAISDLERAIRARDISSESLENSLWIWTALIAIGVVIELWVISLEHKEKVTAWRRGTIKSLERPTGRRLLLELIGPSLVALGVIGELWIGVKVSGVNGELRTLNAELRSKSIQLVGILTGEAGDAKASAETARGAAADATTLAQSARRELKALQLDIALAKAETLDAERKLADLKRPRELTGAQVNRLVDKIRPFAGTPYALGVFRNNESIRLLGVINGALHAAGWVRVLPPGVAPNSVLLDALDMRDGGPPVPYQNATGIIIDWTPWQEKAQDPLFSELAADGLSKGLMGMEFHSSMPLGNGQYVPVNKDTPMTIIVGEKPTWYP